MRLRSLPPFSLLLASLKAKERCPVDRRHKGMSKAPDDQVCLLCTWERSLNISERKSGKSLLMHLCIIVASLTISFSPIGSHFSDRSPSEIWSHFLSPRIIRRARFWTFCNLSILLLLVLLQTVEQCWSLLKTKEFITNKSVFLSKRCLLLLICCNLKRQFEAVLVICWL